MATTSEDPELKSLYDDIFRYDEKYEELNAKVKGHTKTALQRIRAHRPSADVVDVLNELGMDLQKLVDIRAEAAYISRGAKQFYERTLIKRKLEIMSSKEKKIAANVAEGMAVIDSAEEFELMNQAQMRADTSDKRYEATLGMVENLRMKLSYGYEP